jgi:hypothetical protein
MTHTEAQRCCNGTYGCCHDGSHKLCRKDTCNLAHSKVKRCCTGKHGCCDDGRHKLCPNDTCVAAHTQAQRCCTGKHGCCLDGSPKLCPNDTCKKEETQAQRCPTPAPVACTRDATNAEMAIAFKPGASCPHALANGKCSVAKVLKHCCKSCRCPKTGWVKFCADDPCAGTPKERWQKCRPCTSDCCDATDAVMAKAFKHEGSSCFQAAMNGMCTQKSIKELCCASCAEIKINNPHNGCTQGSISEFGIPCPEQTKHAIMHPW